MTVTLAFDTATAETTVAVCAGSDVLAERSAGPGPDGRPRHGPDLLALIEEQVAMAGGWPAIERIAVGVGPGSFTGIRIGVATARALAQARSVPLAGVPSTAALAAGIAATPQAGGRPRLAVIDARRGEAFAAVLQPGAEVAGEPAVADPTALAELARDAGAPLAAGDGALRFRSELEAAGAEVPPDADPVHRVSARFVSALVPSFGPGPAEETRPLYLRRPDAERWRERDRDR